MSEQRDNSGILFVNNRKEKDSHPDRTGTAMIGGTEYYVSGWIKKGQKGPFMSLAFKPKEQERARAPERKPASRNTTIDLDDEIPF